MITEVKYLSYEFGLHLKQCEIVSLLTPPGTPQCYGVSEHHNHTLLDMVRSMMSLTDLPLSFQGYALETAAFTLNRAPSKSVEMTPYELWFSSKPKLSFLKVWSCDAYIKKVFNLISSNPNRRSTSSQNTQRKLLGTPSITDPKARYSLLKIDPFQRRSFSRKK